MQFIVLAALPSKFFLMTNQLNCGHSNPILKAPPIDSHIVPVHFSCFLELLLAQRGQHFHLNSLFSVELENIWKIYKFIR